MNIKDYREKELKTLVIANILVILCLNELITFEGILEENSYMKLLVTIINSGLFAAIIYTMVTVFDCMISSKLKRYIVFWWFPMPGETIFSDIKTDAKDERFTSAEAIEAYQDIYNNLPSGKKACHQYENSKWHELLRQHESETRVLVAHRDYLMCRDMATVIGVMLFLYMIFSFAMKLITFDKKAVIYLGAVYFVCMIAARAKSKRFVKTVIVCDLHPQK